MRRDIARRYSVEAPGPAAVPERRERIAISRAYVRAAREHDEARCVEDFGAVSAQIGSDFLNFTIFNENVTNFILLHGRIYDSAAFNE